MRAVPEGPRFARRLPAFYCLRLPAVSVVAECVAGLQLWPLKLDL